MLNSTILFIGTIAAVVFIVAAAVCFCFYRIYYNTNVACAGVVCLFQSITWIICTIIWLL
jgi:hypothetical protein